MRRLTLYLRGGSLEMKVKNSFHRLTRLNKFRPSFIEVVTFGHLIYVPGLWRARVQARSRSYCTRKLFTPYVRPTLFGNNVICAIFHGLRAAYAHNCSTKIEILNVSSNCVKTEHTQLALDRF